MTKFRRIINGECSFQVIELFDDVKKAANNSNDGEFVECKIEDLKIDFTTVKKEHDGTNPIASAKAEGSSSEETYGISGS
jgi:hypothetical protein